MKRLMVIAFVAGGAVLAHCQGVDQDAGPAAALKFAMSYRGQAYVPGVLHCFPDAEGIPLSETKNIIPMTGSLWTPAELAADFRLRMKGVPEKERRRGIIVMLKTERCCTKEFRACTVTTAALEKRASPLVAEFLIYGAWIQPRDGDNPPGSLKIEEGSDAWKNDAAGIYGFEQGPGATLAFIDPVDGSILGRTDALRLGLFEKEFVANQGRAPKLDAKLEEMLRLLKAPIISRSRALGISSRAKAPIPDGPLLPIAARTESIWSPQDLAPCWAPRSAVGSRTPSSPDTPQTTPQFSFRLPPSPAWKAGTSAP